MKAAGDRLRGRQRTLRQGRQAHVTDTDLQEGWRQRRLDLLGLDVELIRADPDDPDIEDEVGIALPTEALDEGWLGRDTGGVEVKLLAPRLPDGTLRDRDAAASRRLLELDQQHLAGAVLIDGDGLGRTRIRVCDPAGLGLLDRMPMAERQVVETARADLVGRDHDIVAIGLAGDRDRAVDHADVPGRATLLTRDVDVLHRTVRRLLGREDRSVHDDIAGAD